jgi:LacI family transcriptional regulator
MMKRVTIAEIAAAVGVHKSTVSLALRNDPRLSEKTKLRILKEAQKLGYEPDPHLTDLMAYLRNFSAKDNPHKATVAFLRVAPTRAADFHSVAFYAKFRNGVEEECKRLGYGLEDFKSYDYDNNFRRLGDTLLTRNIRGIVLLAFAPEVNLAGFPLEEFAIVTLGHRLIQPSSVHRVISDQLVAMSMAFERFAESGYKRILFASRKGADRAAGKRWTISFHGNQQLFPTVEKTFVYSGPPDSEFVRFFLKCKADALICGGHDFGLKLHASGVHLAKDFGCIPLDSESCPSYFLAIDQQPLELGKLAARAVASMLSRNDLGVPEVTHTLQVIPKWHEGETCPIIDS